MSTTAEQDFLAGAMVGAMLGRDGVSVAMRVTRQAIATIEGGRVADITRGSVRVRLSYRHLSALRIMLAHMEASVQAEYARHVAEPLHRVMSSGLRA